MASDDGRKRIPVFPPIEKQKGSNIKGRRRVAQAVSVTLDAARHSQWHKPSRRLSLEVDRQIISHLKKNLIQRLEKRLNNVDEVEDDLRKRRISRPSSKRKTATPQDIFQKYSEFGEKLTDDGTADAITETVSGSSGSHLEGPTPSSQNINGEERISTSSLPIITTTKSTSSISNQSSRQDSAKQRDLPNQTEAETMGHKSHNSPRIATPTQDNQVQDEIQVDPLEREKSLFNLTKVAATDEEPDLSPVATPIMFRPMTREETRLSFPDRMDRVLSGQVNVYCPPDDRTLKLYIGSGFADTEMERTVLMERVFPIVKEAMLRQNCELEVYDLHWGLKDSISDNHYITNLALDMLMKCKESTWGTCFLLILGEKYGSVFPPATIPADEYSLILETVNRERDLQLAAMAERAAAIETARAGAQQRRAEMTEGMDELNVPESQDLTSPVSLSPVSSERSSSSRLREQAEIIRQEAKIVKMLRQDHTKIAEKIHDALDSSVLNTWYKLDTNVVPAVYRLQNISSHLEDFKGKDQLQKQHAKANWVSIANRIMEILLTAIKELGDDELLRKYSPSLLEMEVTHGILETDDPNDRCFVILRTLDGLRINLSETKTSDYLDIRSKSKRTEVDNEKTEEINKIRDLITEEIDEERIVNFTVPWNSNGIQLSGHRGHSVYLEKLTKAVTDHLLSCINPEHKGDHSTDISMKKELYDEVAHHIRFCHESSNRFHGRKDCLMRIKSYLRAPATAPLVVNGEAGSGKTSLLAKAATHVHKWFSGSTVCVIYRVVGISEKSTNIRMLLQNICYQLASAFGLDLSEIPQDTKGIINYFTDKLAHVPSDKQVILVLDSLDRLSDENEGRKLQWLPKELPAKVHIIVSTLTDEKYVCFKSLTKMYPQNPQGYLEIPQIQEKEAVSILNKWLTVSNRALTDYQYQVILESFKNCPTPLYLHTAFHESMSWPSYMSDEQAKLGDTVKKLAAIKFGKLEKHHGEALVRRALGYITASRDGVTNNEMEDLLSLDEAVMEDVKQKMAPPRRRFPSILWIALREELKCFLLLCRAGTNCTMRWRHVQIQEAAEERYLLSRDKAMSYHKAMADYFIGTWASRPKPHPGNEAGAMRFVLNHSLYLESDESNSSEVKVYNTRRMRELPHHLLNSQQIDLLKSSSLCNFEYILAKLIATSLRALLEEYHIALSVEPADRDLKLLSDTLQLSQRALEKEPRQLGAQIAGRLNGIVAKDVPATAADPCKYPNLKELLLQISKSSIPTLMPSVTCLTEPGGVLFDLLCGHTDAITAATLTTDGMRSITTSKDNTMKLWDLRSGRVVKTIDDVGKDVLYVKTGMANSLAITSEVWFIRIWSLRTGSLVHTIDGFEDPAIITTASEGRLLLAVLDGINTLKVWDLENNFSQRHEIDIKHAGVHQDNSAIIAGNPFGDQILFGARGTKLAYMQNARTGKLIHTIKCHDKASLISCLAITRDYLVLGCKQPYMKLHEIFVLELFDIKRGHFLRTVRGCVHDNLQEIIINQIGSHAIAVCASEQNNMSDIALWNLETEDHKHLARHSNVSRICVCLDFRYCLTAAKSDKSLRMWNLSGKVNLAAPKMKKFNGVGQIIPMVSNPRYVVAKAVNNGPLSVWNIAKAKCLQNAVRIERGLVDPSDVLLVRNSKVIILTDRGFSSVSDDSKPVFQTVLIYNLRTKKYDKKLTGLFITPSPPHEYVLLEGDLLMGLSDNRNHFVIWSLQTGLVVQRIRTNFKEFERQRLERGEDAKPIPSVKRATTAKMLAWDRRSETQEARQKRHEREMDEDKRQVEAIRKEKENGIDQYLISGDYSVIVASFFAHHLCVFDMATHSHKTTLENNSSMLYLYTAFLTNTGSYLAQANYDEETKTSYVTLWNCNTGQVKRRLKNESDVCAIAVANDGERVVFGKSSNELRIWEPMRQNSVRKIKGYAGLNFGVRSKIFMVENDTRALVFAGDISLWDLEQASVLAVFTPDMKIQCCTTALDGKVVAFGLLESTDVVVLKLVSRDIQPIQDNQGEELFGETTGDTSDEDEDEDSS